MRKLITLAVGAVMVAGAGSSVAATRATDIQLYASPKTIVYGQSAHLNGTLLDMASGNARVSIFRALENSSTEEATEAFSVQADSAGNFEATVAPTIGTNYYAAYEMADGTRITSDPITINVRPKVTLTRYARRGNTLFLRASVKTDNRSYGKVVNVQRLGLRGHWVTIKQVRLASNIRPTSFSVVLRQHLTHLRVQVPARRMGVGYVAGWSGWVTAVKR